MWLALARQCDATAHRRLVCRPRTKLLTSPRMSSIAKILKRLGPAAAAIACFALILSCDAARSTSVVKHLELNADPPRMAVRTGEYVKVYVHAHQDDWELFMSDRTTSG